MRKKLFIFLFLLCGAVGRLWAQQPLEVVIVACSHYNGSEAAAYRPIIEKLAAYKPDMVFGEYLSGADAQRLPNQHATWAGYRRRISYLQRHAAAPPLTARAAATAQRQLRRHPLLARPRIDLTRYYTQGYDRGNAEYQAYMLEEQLKKNFTAADQAYYAQAFGAPDSLVKAKMVRPLSEYHKIVFPLLSALGHGQLYAMDCQQYDAAWNEASSKVYTQYQALQTGFKADSSTAQAATYRRIDDAKKAYFAHLNAAETDVAAYQLLNAPPYEKLDAALNFYGGEALYGAPGFPTEAAKAMQTQWELRNQGMCDNVVRQARQQGATKVLVAVGASHGQEMRRLLARMPNVRVRTYNDLP